MNTKLFLPRLPIKPVTPEKPEKIKVVKKELKEIWCADESLEVFLEKVPQKDFSNIFIESDVNIIWEDEETIELSTEEFQEAENQYLKSLSLYVLERVKYNRLLTEYEEELIAYAHNILNPTEQQEKELYEKLKLKYGN